MRPIDLLAKISMTATLAVVFMSQSGEATAQVVVNPNPTHISSFPLTAELPSGTYYYSVNANSGPATITLEFTPPDGGGGMSVSVSGPDCCGSDAYVGTDTGLSTLVRREATFNVPSRQRLVLAAYISVRPQATVRFTINISPSAGGGEGTGDRGSGVIVTPPPSTPVHPPSRVCTDLGLIDPLGVEPSRDLSSITITGVLRNLSPTPYIANPHYAPRRSGWLEVVAIQGPGVPRRIVRQIAFTEVAANGSRPFRVVDTTASRAGRLYEVRILYSAANYTDRTTTNDDCNGANNVIRTRPILASDDTVIGLEPLPKPKSKP